MAHSYKDYLDKNFRTSLFKNTNNKLTILDNKERQKLVKPTIISEVFSEQIPLIILTILYLIFKYSNT